MDEIACALLDRIAASPGGGDADHLVLADHLMQHGHARWGELVALSCAERRGPLTRAQRHRLYLLRGDLRSWLGPIKPVTFRQRIDRGLLVATGLDGRRRGMVAAALGHLAWRTVREVELHEHARWAGHFRANDEIAALLRSLPALAALKGVTMDIVATLAAEPSRPLPIRALELFLYRPSGDRMYRELHEQLGGPAFAGVRELALGYGIYRERHLDLAELDWWLGAAPITSHTEVLGLGLLPQLEPWRQALERAAGPGWSRLAARKVTALHHAPTHYLDQLVSELDQIAPGSLTSIELEVALVLLGAVERLRPRIAERQPHAAIEVTRIPPDPPRA